MLKKLYLISVVGIGTMTAIPVFANINQAQNIVIYTCPDVNTIVLKNDGTASAPGGWFNMPDGWYSPPIPDEFKATWQQHVTSVGYVERVYIYDAHLIQCDYRAPDIHPIWSYGSIMTIFKKTPYTAKLMDHGENVYMCEDNPHQSTHCHWVDKEEN